MSPPSDHHRSLHESTTTTTTTICATATSHAKDTDFFFMPAEWYPHAACIMLYPHNRQTFPRLEAVRQEVLQIAQTIAQSNEPVIMLCNTAETALELQRELQHKQYSPSVFHSSDNNNTNHAGIHVAVCPSDDTWARDTAPTFVISHSRTRSTSSSSLLCGLDFDFNAYGGRESGCYWPCDSDQAIASRVCNNILVEFFLQQKKQEKQQQQQDGDTTAAASPRPLKATRALPAPQLPLYRHVPLVLEGGSIHSDGGGAGQLDDDVDGTMKTTILTTEECLLHPNRNPTKSKQDIETILKQELGASKVIWLPHGLAHDDDTNGHVDNWACFVGPAHVVLSWTDWDEEDHENYQRCRQALQILESSTDAAGRPLQITKLHLPRPIYYDNVLQDNNSADSNGNDNNNNIRGRGQRMAASYLNFYIANGSVIVPQFGDNQYDAMAIETLVPLFPDRKVIGIYTKELLYGGDNIHCITQQVPAVMM